MTVFLAQQGNWAKDCNCSSGGRAQALKTRVIVAPFPARVLYRRADPASPDGVSTLDHFRPW
jgi:hypothetical protein